MERLSTRRCEPQLISVVMPVLNAEKHIGDQLAALAGQMYRGRWELVVVDNGCTDRSIDVVRAWAVRLPAVYIADATRRRGVNYARNVGIDTARGDFLVFCDADDVAAPGWLAGIAAAAPDGDLVAGSLDRESLNASTTDAWRVAIQGFGGEGFLPFAPGGNCGVWADVARELHFDEEFAFGSSDIEFSWRAQRASYRLAVTPDAVMRVRTRRGLGELAGQFYAYGVSGPLLYRRFAPQGMPRPRAAGVAGDWLRVFTSAPALHRADRRAHAVKLAAFRFGRLVGSVRHRTLFL